MQRFSFAHLPACELFLDSPVHMLSMMQDLPSTMDGLVKGGSLDWVKHAGQSFKADALIIGEAGVTSAIDYEFLQDNAQVQKLRPLLQSMASWLSKRLSASHAPSPPTSCCVAVDRARPSEPPSSFKQNHSRPIVVTFVSRLHSRRILNLHEVTARFKSRHNNNNVIVHVQVMEHLSFAAQES